MNHAALKFDTRQNQALTPRLQYAVRLLQLSSLDYAQELQDTMAKNPFLENDDIANESGAVTETAGPDSWGLDAAQAPMESVTEPSSAADFDSSYSAYSSDSSDASDASDPSDSSSERDQWLQSPSGVRASSSDSQTSAIDMVVADVQLRQHLRSQANTLPLSARDLALVCAVIESLDDDGYLRTELDEIAPLAALQPPADACETSTALKLVQSFDPPGVGARNVAECLLLQLDTLAEAVRPLARGIITDHLDRLAERDVPGIARRLGRPASEVDAACQAIRRLDPRPGARFGSADVHYVNPDVLVRKVRGKWVAQLNSAIVPKVRLNQSCAELFQRHKNGKHPELSAHLQEARWAVRNVEQRFSTILSVAEAILRRQHLFLEYGAFAMKPLGLREIAEEVGLHESTVCRVTNNKYMATPAGVFELKHFFSRAMPMASGGACSATAIRGVMQELIAAEDPVHPLSDVEIAQRLSRQGLTVARRTVTKYRQMLKVPPVERRRQHSASPQALKAGAAAGDRIAA